MTADAEHPGTLWLCATCGVEHIPAEEPPPRCEICADERQYLPADGVQRWTTLEELAASGRGLGIEEVERGLWGIEVAPETGIGQRALLVQTSGGNLLWDVPPYIDDAGVEQVARLGGVAAIVASHPHMYGVQLEWSAAFGDAPVWVAEKDAHWVARPGPAIRTWSRDLEVLRGITLTQPGGHFAGSSVALWSGAPDGKGVLLAGDTVSPASAQGWVSFMRSYPNRIPLSAAVVRRVADHVTGLDFDRLYGNFSACLPRDARGAVRRSADRYIGWVTGQYDADT